MNKFTYILTLLVTILIGCVPTDTETATSTDTEISSSSIAIDTVMSSQVTISSSSDPIAISSSSATISNIASYLSVDGVFTADTGKADTVTIETHGDTIKFYRDGINSSNLIYSGNQLLEDRIEGQNWNVWYYGATFGATLSTGEKINQLAVDNPNITKYLDVVLGDTLVNISYPYAYPVRPINDPTNSTYHRFKVTTTTVYSQVSLPNYGTCIKQNVNISIDSSSYYKYFPRDTVTDYTFCAGSGLVKFHTMGNFWTKIK